MKGIIFRNLLTALLLFFLFSCEEGITDFEPKGVIEGTFNSDGYPEIMFSRSIVPGEEGTLKDAMINWGKVTISDDEREVILTGEHDPGALPPFRYTSLEMKGDPGKTYKITASFRDLNVSASCRMPFPTPIDSITFAATDNDTLIAATLHFTSPADTPAYYYLSMRQPGKEKRSLPCMMGTICTESPNRVYSIPVLRPRIKIDSIKYQSQLVVGEEWIVSLNRVEKEVYEFRRAYDNMQMFSTSPFLNGSESLPTNIQGGYGIWSPQGTDTRHIKIPQPHSTNLQ